MSNFTVYEFSQCRLNPIQTNELLEDWDAVRKWFTSRGRNATSQVLVIHNEQIYAVERRDGNGFAMVDQDRQNGEDGYWYPKTPRENELK